MHTGVRGKNKGSYMAAVLRLKCLSDIYGSGSKIIVSIGSLYSNGFIFYAIGIYIIPLAPWIQ